MGGGDGRCAPSMPRCRCWSSDRRLTPRPRVWSALIRCTKLHITQRCEEGRLVPAALVVLADWDARTDREIGVTEAVINGMARRCVRPPRVLPGC